MTEVDSSVIPFEFHPRTRIVFGAGTLERIGALAGEIAGGTTLLVTDEGLRTAGHLDRVRDLLETAGMTVVVFDGVRENPTTADVAECLEVAKFADIDLIVGLGGGSSMDTAKGCNFLLTNGGVMKDYWGYGKAPHPMVPMIAIPTTAGTGSECQSYALIADEITHQKMACGDPKVAFRLALLDPELTLTQPRMVSIATGIDTLAHALESLVSTRRTAMSLVFARESFRLFTRHFATVLEQPEDLTARGGMQLAASFGGLAIENSMLGAAHASANPLTANYGIVHGYAVGMMLVSVMSLNRTDPAAEAAYAELAVMAGLASAAEKAAAAVDTLIAFVDDTLNRTEVARSLSAYGITEDALSTLAQEATSQWTGTFNPVKVDEAKFVELYQDILSEKAPGGRSAVRTGER